jgi:leucyl-tRNA synthetase
MTELIDVTTEKNWMPVDMYIGGPEHACMHLIYARFVMMALKDFGYMQHSEPFKKLVHQGLITNQGAKMSKSKGNVVSPDEFVERHGSDVFRLYLMFMGPFTDGGDWSDTGIKGTDRFVQRIFKVVTEQTSKDLELDDEDVLHALHKSIKKVAEDIEKLHFNTAISTLMELLNVLESKKSVSLSTAKAIALMLSPLAPHLSEELWEFLGGKGERISAIALAVESETDFLDSSTLSNSISVEMAVLKWSFSMSSATFFMLLCKACSTSSSSSSRSFDVCSVTTLNMRWTKRSVPLMPVSLQSPPSVNGPMNMR